MKYPLIAFIFMVATLPALAALEKGASAPDFTAPASQAGETFTYSLVQARGNGPVIVYFYPSAFTPGCNIQARTFAVNMQKFADAGASVVGVSLDSIERLNDFSADPEYCAGKLPVVSDTDGSIADSFDLNVAGPRDDVRDTRGESISHGFAERTTFVVSREGMIVGTVGGVSPRENVEMALEIVRGLSVD